MRNVCNEKKIKTIITNINEDHGKNNSMKYFPFIHSLGFTL